MCRPHKLNRARIEDWHAHAMGLLACGGHMKGMILWRWHDDPIGYNTCVLGLFVGGTLPYRNKLENHPPGWQQTWRQVCLAASGSWGVGWHTCHRTRLLLKGRKKLATIGVAGSIYPAPWLLWRLCKSQSGTSVPCFAKQSFEKPGAMGSMHYWMSTLTRMLYTCKQNLRDLNAACD